MLGLLALVVALSLLAPVYADSIAHTEPFRSNLGGTTTIDGRRVPVMEASSAGLGLGVTPIGPTWDPGNYFLGADGQGRDVAARLLYGGRNSLLIGISAALLTCLLGTLVGLVAGFFGGVVDGVLSRLLEVVWAFPVYLLAISLSIGSRSDSSIPAISTPPFRTQPRNSSCASGRSRCVTSTTTGHVVTSLPSKPRKKRSVAS